MSELGQLREWKEYLDMLWWQQVYTGTDPGKPRCVVTLSSVQFSYSVMSNSLWPHGLQHARPPCPSPTPRACSKSYPSSRWCHPTISSSVVHFSFCLQSFPASGSFSMTLIMAFITPSNYLLTAWVSPSPALAGRLQGPWWQRIPSFQCSCFYCRYSMHMRNK